MQQLNNNFSRKEFPSFQPANNKILTKLEPRMSFFWVSSPGKS